MPLFICQGCGAEHGSWGGKCPNCGTSETIRLAPSTDRMVDRVIKGKFKIVKKLGQGGMGAVYLAEQLGIGHRVALKFLKSEFSSDAEIARRFLNEAKSYARVAHPNAVALHDFGQDDEGNLFIAMEYCEGTDLKKVIAEQGRLPMLEAIEVVLQVADVLANAHEKGVIHRDLKPENIMIRRGMRGVHAKVLDFGIARLMDAGTKLTVAGAIAGTPRYMSPEQVEGKEVDLRADIYSLGICLYETLTGQQPFDGNSITEILRKQVLEPLPPLTLYTSDLDYPALEAVLQRACAKKIADRWPDMTAFANALSQAIPTQAHLSVPPLQRTGVSGRIVVTPTPAALGGQAATMTELDGSTDRTLVRGDSNPPSQPLPQPPSAVTQAGQLTQPAQNPLSAPIALHTPVAPAPQAVGTGSLPPVAPKSNAPILALAGVVVVLAGIVLAVSLRPSPPAPTDRPTAVEKPVEPPPEKPAPSTAPQQVQIDVAAKALAEQSALLTLGNARSRFDNAELDECETLLKAIPEGTASSAEAKLLLERIDTIRSRLREADGLRSQGKCQAAIPVYRQVLDLNRKLAAAQTGLGRCTEGSLPSTIGE